MRKLLPVALAFVLIACRADSQQSILLDTPPASLTLLGEGFLSTAMNERDFALSPDGKEIYFTISTPKSTFQTIVFCKKGKDGWSKPEVAPFAGKYSDLEPAFSPDGNTLYFASNRPVEGDALKDFDIWKVTRAGNSWGQPQNLGKPVNTEADEFYPSVAKSGNLYFTAAYAGGPGREDIYVSHFKQNEFQKPVALDTAVNTRFYEFNAFVSPDEDYIIFTSYGRKDDTGGGDLYISMKDQNGSWKPARNLKLLNSKQLDYCPFVSPDGKSLFFTSERHQLPTAFTDRADYKTIDQIKDQPLNGLGNIYWISFKSVLNSLK
ncbi:MAG: PD40 domain-containing protein [Cyclobacteriaceae bacterium]|nr:PD40 domain-containing protein [Cyclobacteriaceae bacterium]